jgi:hypothetical protein
MNETQSPQTTNLQGYDPSVLFAQGFSLGTADLIQGSSFSEVIGRTIITLLMHLKDANNKSPFAGVSVILPPASATSLNDEAVFAALAEGVKDLRGSEPNAQELEFLKGKVCIVNCPTLDTTDLEASILSEGKRRLVAVASASIYRDIGIESPSSFGLSAVLTSEDLWVPHVVSLCQRCVAVMRSMEGYAVIHVEESPATQPHNTEQLCSVDDCYVACLALHYDKKEEVERRAHRWLTLALAGDLATAIAELDSLQLSEVNHNHVLAQLFYRAGMYDNAITTMEQLLPSISELDPSNRVQLARVAHKSGDDSLALKFLPDDAESVSSVIWIEEGLELATVMGGSHLIERYDSRLTQMYPSSERLRENRDRRLLWNCSSKTQEGGQALTTAGLTRKHLEILNAVISQKPDYEQIIEHSRKWGTDWYELTAICCSMHAWSVGQAQDAADIACQITTSDLYGRQATQVVLRSVRSLMLKEQIHQDDRDYYRVQLQAAIRFLAFHPEDGTTRSLLSRLLSVDSCGEIGIPIVATTMLDIAKDGVKLTTSDEIERKLARNGENSVEQERKDIKESIEKGLVWLSAHGAAEYGVTTLPTGLVPYPDETIRLLMQMILFSAPKAEDVDLRLLESLTMLVCAISPHATSERNQDLSAVRLLAGHFAMAGQFQQARNLAEQSLVMGQGNALRQRLAWLGFADIYHRCRNMTEALVGLSCALATNAPVSKAELWQEVHTTIRVLRDLGLFQLAHNFLPTLKTLAGDVGLDAEHDPRIVASEMSLRLVEVDSNNNEEITAIISGLSSGCERAITDRSLLLPLVVMLGQAVQKAKTAGLHVDESTLELMKTGRTLLGPQASQLVGSVSSDAPSAAAVTSMFNQVQRALYTADAAGDFEIVGLSARRLLNDQDGQPTSAGDKALAIEIMSDHAVLLPVPPSVMEVDWPVLYAKSLNDAGLDVVFLGLDSVGELVVTHASNGHVQSIKQPHHDRSFRLRIQTWLEDYPRQYGYVDAADGDNEFFITMERLDVRLPAPESLLVIAEPLLQQLTLNLGVVTPENGGYPFFLGTTTAVGMTPSLTWLSMARVSERSGKTAYKAWISTQEGPEANGTLSRALERLSGTFEDFRFTVDNGRQLPSDLSDAGLAVITAHGGLTKEGRYIHSIRDEDSLFEAPTALAAALAGVEVVILFVCSGGRIDKHPWGNTTVGLPKLLLNNGCRVVIASPWPLDVKVTYNWLEPFLREWEAGSTVLCATKRANEEVAGRLGGRPQYSLAMTAYGDILLTKQ